MDYVCLLKTAFEQISPFQLLRVNFESTVDWRVTTNLLRVNPKFHGKPRYDCVVIKVDDNSYIFARLLFIFQLKVFEKEYHIALVLPLDIPPGLKNRQRDIDLRFTSLRARHRSLSVFISVESIVRGSLLAADYESEYPDEYVVVDMVDSDLWLRVKSLSLACRVDLGH